MNSFATALRADLRGTSYPAIAGITAACIGVAYSAVQWPWVVTGLVFGAIVLLVVIAEPLALVAFMLASGPADLSFVTGGFKSLFTAAGGLDMNGIRLLGVVGGFLVLFLVEPRVQRQVFSRDSRWYVLFLLWAGATLAMTLSPVDGLRLLLKLAYPLITFVMVAALVDRKEQLERLLRYTLVAAVIIVLINPLFVLGGGYDTDDAGFRRIGGLGTYANPFSFYLLVILLISFGRFIVRGQLRYLVLCVPLGVWIYLTLTRITLLALFAGIAVMVLYAALAGRHYRAIAGAVLVAIAVGIPIVPSVLERSLGFIPTPTELAALMRSPSTFYESVNWQGRDVIWPIVYGSASGQPLTGIGLGSSSVVMRQNFPPQVGDVVHNEYLRLFSETGLIGMGLFFLAMLRWTVTVARTGWQASPRVREFALPALAAIVSWACIAITDNAFDYYAAFTQYVGFLCAGTVVAARLSAGERDERLPA